MATLIVSIIGTLFRGVLLMYGVLPLSKPDSEIITGFWNVFFAWVSIISFGMFAASITVLAFQTLRVIMMESQNTITIRLLWLGKTITKRNSPVDEREPSVKP